MQSLAIVHVLDEAADGRRRLAGVAIGPAIAQPGIDDVRHPRLVHRRRPQPVRQVRPNRPGASRVRRRRPEAKVMLAGERSLADIADEAAVRRLASKGVSGRQAYLETLVNRYFG